MNCKPGDIALVIGSIAGNLGRIVHVLWQGRHASLEGPAWLVECVSGRLLYGRQTLDGPINLVDCVIFLDRQLRPVSGLDPGDAIGDPAEETLEVEAEGLA